MKNRSSIRTEINLFYRNKVNGWLTSHVKEKKDPPADFPVSLYLGAPTLDEEVKKNKDAFLRFCKDWQEPLIAGHVDFLEKSYDGIGTVQVPIHLVFDKPSEVATWAGNLVEYNSAVERLDVIAKELPELVDSALSVISSISNLEASDFYRFTLVCKWLLENRKSHALIRSIPVRGVDTRWFEINRHLLLDFLREKLDLNPVRKDLLQLGLIPPPSLVTLRVLDHVLRGRAGGMSYFSTTCADLEKLNLKPIRVIFMDNVPTVLSLPDMPGTVIIITPVTGLEESCKVSWVANARCQYFGSIDLNSFAKLHNLRLFLPKIESVLMDEETFFAHRDLWTYDDVGTFSGYLGALNEREAWFYRALVDGSYGFGVRLSQERLPLDCVFKALGIKGDDLDDAEPEPLEP